MVLRKLFQHAREHRPDQIEADKKADHHSQWPHRPSDSIADISQEAISVLLLSAKNDGEIGGLGYWQVANAYTAILYHDIWSSPGKSGVPAHAPLRSPNLAFVCRQVDPVLQRHSHCINDFNDDTLWWGHLLLLLFSATGDERYLAHCAEIHRRIGWFVLPKGMRDHAGHDLDGGVKWKATPDCNVANSITTSLWAEFCARLAVIVHESHLAGAVHDILKALPSAEKLLIQAVTSMRFVHRYLHRESDNVILDTLELDSGKIVDWTFTYTTGQSMAAWTAIDAASRTLRVSNDSSHPASPHIGQALQHAIAFARAALTRDQWIQGPDARVPGVLTEYCAYGPDNHKAHVNDDAVGFKSVLVRSLAKLHQYMTKLVQESTQSSSTDVPGVTRDDMSALCMDVEAFVTKTYQSLLQYCSNDRGQYGPWWAGPMDTSTAHSQMAVLDVMAAMRLFGT